MGQLGRIALGFRRDGIHALFIDLPIREGGQNRANPQFPEKSCPEGVILVHIQHSGQSNSAPDRLLLGQGLIGKHPFLLECHHIGCLFPLASAAGSLFTAVSGNVPAAAGEHIDGQHTVVGTASAADRFGGVGQIHDVLQRHHGSSLSLIMVPGNECGAESTHETGNIGANYLGIRDGFKGAEHRLIVEGAALNHDMTSQFPGRAELDHLEERVFDHGIGKTRGNIRNLGSLLLGLLDIGIHKYGAAGTQIHRMLGKQRFLRKILGGIAQRIGEILNERAAA